MKNKFYFGVMIMAVLSIGMMMLSSCDDDHQKILKFNPTKVEVNQGNTARVQVSHGKAPFTVTSSDSKVASGNITGSTLIVLGVKPGRAILTVTDSKQFTGKLTVIVKDKVTKSLMLDKSMVAVGTGKSEMVMVKNGTAPYTATSKDNKVATASVKDNKITVTGVKAGTTTVTITDKNKLNATLAVTVK